MQPTADKSPVGIYATLRIAVLAKQPVAAIYEGRPRLLCPHILGWTEAGLPHLVWYQYGGDSERGLGEDGSPRNWRCMDVGILRSVELLEGAWKTASNYRLPHPCVPQVDVAVAVGAPLSDGEPQNGQ
jgi:hypothetical protein